MAEDFNTLKNALIADNKATADKKAREDDQRYREEDKKLDDLISEQKNFYTLTDKNGKKVNDGRTIQSKLTKSALDNQILNMQETKALRNDIKETRSKEKKDLDINKSVLEKMAASIESQGKSVADSAEYQEEVKKVRLQEFALKKQDLDGSKLEKVNIEEQKFLLEKLKEEIESSGGKAEENKEFNKQSYDLQMREFDLRKRNATSASAQEEIEKERRKVQMEQGTYLEKISAGIMGMRSSMKDSAKAALKSAGKGIFAILKGTLFAGLLFAFANFLKSPMFGEMIDYLDNTLTPIVKGFYNNFLKPVGAFLKENLGEFFKDLANFAKDPSLENLKKFDLLPTITAITAIIALLKPSLLLKGLKGSVKLLSGAFNLLSGKVTDTASSISGGGDQKPNQRGGGKQPGRVMKMAKGIQTMGMSAGKGIGGFIGGILKGIASGLAAIATPPVLVGLAAVVLAINGIAAAIRIASPAFAPIGKLMKDFGASVREVFGGLGTFVKDIGKSIEGVIKSIGESIGKVIDKISSMKTAGTEATTKQIKSLSDIPSENLFAAAKGIDAMKKALNDFGGGTFANVAKTLFGGNGPIDKLVALTKKVPALMKAAEAISVISAAGGDYAMAQQEIKRRERVAQLEKEMAGDKKGRVQSQESFDKEQAARQAELNALEKQKMELKISGNRRLGGPMNAGEAYIVGETSGAKELVIPKTDSMVLNENKTDAIINNALDKSSGKTTSAPLVIASTNTNAPVNHNSTNVASNTFVEPDPIFRRNTQFAI